MDFARKSKGYVVQHTKSQAIEELKEDERVSNIIRTTNGMFIETKPIVPKTCFEKKLLLVPIGDYIIHIKKYYPKTKSKYLRIIIKRKQGFVMGPRAYGVMHSHIESETGEKICWGSATTEIDKVRLYGDWYWAGKMCLELLDDLYDGRLEELSTAVGCIDLQSRLQISYINDEKFTKKMKKLVRNYILDDEKLMKDLVDYNDSCESPTFFMEIPECKLLVDKEREEHRCSSDSTTSSGGYD